MTVKVLLFGYLMVVLSFLLFIIIYLFLYSDNRLYMETPKPSVKLRKKKSRPAYKGTSRKSSRRAVAKKESDQDMDENEQEWIPWKLVRI